jgi:mono/diheme cytochrome c family protein
MRRSWNSLVVATLLLALAACGGKGDAPAPAGAGQAGGGTPGSDLTPFQLEHGIGPVTAPVEVGPIDEKMAEQGEQLFEAKCALCHKMEERYVGPALGTVTQQRSPAFIMNMILNPEAMYTRHPVVRQLLADHMTQMPSLGLTQEQARQIVEYLRTKAPTQAGS